MPVPKRKVSKSRRDQRSASKHIKPHAIASCSNCEHPLVPHQACENCGFYKGKKVITTKMERSLKRGQARQAQAARKKVAESSEESGNEKS